MKERPDWFEENERKEAERRMQNRVESMMDNPPKWMERSADILTILVVIGIGAIIVAVIVAALMEILG